MNDYNNQGLNGISCKGCGRQDKQLNVFDWLVDVPGNIDETDFVEVQFKNTRKGIYVNNGKKIIVR